MSNEQAPSRPNIIHALVYLFEGVIGTVALGATLWVFKEDGSVIPLVIAALALPGYALQLGYIAYLMGALSPRSRRVLWLSSMIMNLTLVPASLIPLGMFATLLSLKEALMMVPITLNAFFLAVLGVFAYLRERGATLA